jgi:AraC-like DNA-binding protein/ligand-binding sensor protein
LAGKSAGRDRTATDRERNMMTDDNANLLEALNESRIYRDYERAFTEATGLPVALRPVESWQLPHHNRRNENRFCSLMATKSKACAACLQVQARLAEAAQEGPCTLTCELGLVDTAVPVKLGEKLIGFLQTGQVFQKRPSQAQFDQAAQRVAEWGIQVEREELRQAYYSGKVLGPKQYDSMVKLLAIFAQHISMVTNQIALQQANAEPPAITRAKNFIEQNHAEEISLGAVAKAVNTSTFYFCKLFKKATGINFTEYVSRVRIEKSKNLLLNRNLRVSEIAYEVGFQSLTHFNRVFKKIVGQSPTEYRAQLPAAA